MLNNNKPFFTIEEARRIAFEAYDLRAEVYALQGERDCNFRLKTGTRQEFVLKIAPAVEQRDTLDLQNKALVYLASHDSSLLLPHIRVTTRGEDITTVISAEGMRHFARLLTFVPGRVLAETRPHTLELLHSLGSMMGKMDGALQDFTHPAAHRMLKWDLQHTLWIHDFLQASSI